MLKLSKKFKKTTQNIYIYLANHLKITIYTLLFLIGSTVMALSFFLGGNWSNVACGIGSGIFTSLFVTIIINHEHETQEFKKTEQEKRFLLNNIIEYSLDVYEDIIFRINEYITLQELNLSEKYALYNDFKPFNEFADYLKTIDITTLSDTDKKRLDTLFNFGNYRIDQLITELKHLPKHEYYLRGILTQEECIKLTSQHANDSYLSYAEHIDEFWDNRVLNLTRCIQFLRMTIFITSKTISVFDFAIRRAQIKEQRVADDIAQIYYDEIFCKSEEYAFLQMHKQEAEQEYYASHPEELEALEKQFEEEYNKTPEDRYLENLSDYIWGFSEFDITDILKKLDKNSPKVQKFFKQKNLQKMLRKDRKTRHAICLIYGKRYLKDILRSEVKDNG